MKSSENHSGSTNPSEDMPTPPDAEADELLVYDSKEEEYKTIHTIPINDKDKVLLKYLFEKDEEEFVSISELKDKTGIKRRNLDTRFKKFGRRYGLFEITKKDADEVPFASPPRMARLTEKGRNAIKVGLIGDPDDEEITPVIDLTKEDIEDIEEKFKNLEKRVNSLQNEVEEQQSTIISLEEKLQSAEEEIQSFSKWKKSVKTFVLATRYTFENSDIKFRKYFKKAKKEMKKKELQDGNN